MLPCRTRRLRLALLGIALLAVPQLSLAQPGPHMCGNGTTFTVELPGRNLGFDDANSIFTSISPTVGSDDTITLPNGCSIYAFLVSGYKENAELREVIFYKLAEFVAKNDGYVHVAWWNNLLRPYMQRPLHPDPVTVGRLFPLPDQVLLALPYNPYAPLATFDLFPTFVDMPKANPDEDFQFQSDIALVIKAIKLHNPLAIVVVAGHSMGGASVVRLGRDKTVPIDLLAPIDAGNNRDKPIGVDDTKTENRTRWRGTHDYKGWKQWDCVRTNGNSGPCKPFFTSIFSLPTFQCRTVEPWLDEKPLFANATINIGCRKSEPFEDVNAPLYAFGNNVQNLYNRWQHESFPPAQHETTYRFQHTKPLSSSLIGGNYQQPVQTCDVGLDPHDPLRLCNPLDGHMEIIGARLRLLPPGIDRGGYEMRNWPHILDGDAPDRRRDAFIDMKNATSSWVHRPENPDLCLVCDGMITIVQHLLDLLPTPPSVDGTAPGAVATPTPDANGAGWHNTDVVLTVLASDEARGSGVKEIQTTLTGAQTASLVTPGAMAEVSVSSEGMTTLSYFARDNAGNAPGVAETLTVKIDKTGPGILAERDGEPNVHGWFNRNVTITFTASDEPGGSGLAMVDPSVVVSFEAANREIVGIARDIADNESTAPVTLSIDKTPPAIALSSRTVANAFDWNNEDVTVSWNCTDGLAGAVSANVSQTVSSEGAGQQAIGTCADFADNTSSDTVPGINIDKTAPSITILSPADGSVHLLNAPVAASYGCADALSGIAACSGSVANGAALDTATVGVKSLLVNASDVAGNVAAAASNYAVLYVFSGFTNPAASLPAVNIVRAGRTVPIKYSLRDGNGALLSDLASFVTIVSWAVACDTGQPEAPAEESDAPGSTSVSFDDGQFHFNWQTSSSWTGCRMLELRLNDGSAHQAKFQFR